jgi:hypothetical protein
MGGEQEFWRGFPSGLGEQGVSHGADPSKHFPMQRGKVDMF